jgi:hypothetical protein
MFGSYVDQNRSCLGLHFSSRPLLRRLNRTCMRRASDAPWKVWGNRLAYRMSRTEKISGRHGD